MRTAVLVGFHLTMAALLCSAAAEPSKPVPAARIHVPSMDVNKPMPVPILAKPLPDRASVDDITSDASNAAAVSATMPERTKPAPFQKVTLPDPFENRKPVAPAVTTSEQVPNSTPSLPKR
jgi:hypothetical protein